MDKCEYDGKLYSHGAEKCQEGHLHRCDDGEWMPLGLSCNDGDADESTESEAPSSSSDD